MILSAGDILRKQPVYPLYQRRVFNGMSFGLSHAGYDIRIKQSRWLWPKRFCLASSIEKFQMTNDILAIVHDKSTWARKGLSVFNTVIEPGWEGYLTLELVNNSWWPIYIPEGSPIAQVVFHKLTSPVEGYKGKYQGQPNKPVGALYE